MRRGETEFYRGLYKTQEVFGPKGQVHPGPSLKLRNHSPTGFAWGYGGSGPAQLALALLLDWSGDEDLALRLYQQFKWEKVVRWPMEEDWSMKVSEIEAWLGTVVEKTA